MGFDVWLSAMSCVRLVTASETEITTSSSISIPLYNIVTIVQIHQCVIQYVASKTDFSFFLNITSEGSCRNF